MAIARAVLSWTALAWAAAFLWADFRGALAGALAQNKVRQLTIRARTFISGGETTGCDSRGGFLRHRWPRSRSQTARVHGGSLQIVRKIPADIPHRLL